MPRRGRRHAHAYLVRKEFEGLPYFRLGVVRAALGLR